MPDFGRGMGKVILAPGQTLEQATDALSVLSPRGVITFGDVCMSMLQKFTGAAVCVFDPVTYRVQGSPDATPCDALRAIATMEPTSFAKFSPLSGAFFYVWQLSDSLEYYGGTPDGKYTMAKFAGKIWNETGKGAFVVVDQAYSTMSLFWFAAPATVSAYLQAISLESGALVGLVDKTRDNLIFE